MRFVFETDAQSVPNTGTVSRDAVAVTTVCTKVGTMLVTLSRVEEFRWSLRINYGAGCKADAPLVTSEASMFETHAERNICVPRVSAVPANHHPAAARKRLGAQFESVVFQKSRTHQNSKSKPAGK